MKAFAVVASAAFPVWALILACGGSGVTEPPSGCGSALSFTVLPVSLSTVSAVTPIGNMGPPVHTIPTDHVGFYLNATGGTLSAPGPLRVTTMIRVRYLVSPFRQGTSDYAITAAACGGYQIVLGHVATVAAKLASAAGNCSTYSTADETVERCEQSVDVQIAAGETLGTVGTIAGGAFDLGLYNPAIQNFFVNPGRYSSRNLTAVCPYDAFTADLRAALYAKLGDPGLPASGEAPVCGAMSVDVAGTARGVWVLQSAPVNQQGDETNFAVLAPHPLYPQSGQAFAIGLASLSSSVGGGLTKFPRSAAGRVNRQFADLTADGLIYCYVYNTATAAFSYFVRLGAGTVLTIQKLSHSAGATPCSADPATWAFSGAAVAFIR